MKGRSMSTREINSKVDSRLEDEFSFIPPAGSGLALPSNHGRLA